MQVMNLAGGGEALPIGCLLALAHNTIPTNYLACDGSEVNQSDYPNLYALLGTLWGSAASGKFKLPNLNRRTLLGDGGTGSATIGNAVGNTGGAESHVLTVNEMPSHAHTVGIGASAIARVGSIGGQYGLLDSGNSGSSGSLNLGANGNGFAHNNIQPCAVIKWVIKAK